MPFFLVFAFKNLGRHRRRTLVTAAALAVGLAVFVFVDSMLRGMDAESERNLIWYEVAGARAASPEAAAEPDKLSLKYPLADLPKTLGTLKSLGVSVTPRLAFEAELSAPGPGTDGTRVVRAVGTDAQTDPAVFPRKGISVQGRWFRSGEPAVVLGVWLAADLKISVGRTLSLVTRTRAGSFQVIDLEVVGIAASPDPVLNRTGVFLPLDVAQTQLEMPDQATEVDIGMAPGDDDASLKVRVQSALVNAGLSGKVLSWKDLAGDFVALAAAKEKGSGMILFFVFLIAAVGVGNTLLMAFYERKTEIGVLRALGMSDRRLFWTFLAEAGGIGVVGSVLGLALGAVAVGWLVTWGVDFTSLVRKMDIGYRTAGVMYGVWVPGTFAAAGVLGVVLSVVCAVGPTRRALRLPITESLRAE